MGRCEGKESSATLSIVKRGRARTARYQEHAAMGVGVERLSRKSKRKKRKKGVGKGKGKSVVAEDSIILV